MFNMPHLIMRSMFSADHVFLPLNCHWITIELPFNTFEFMNTSDLHSQSVFLSVSLLMCCNSYSYYWLPLLLSGYISLNPGPFHKLQPLGQNEWTILKHRELHFLHLNMNSLLPKIDKLTHIARLTNVAVIRISESKLDDSVPTSEIQTKSMISF